jgi:arginase
VEGSLRPIHLRCRTSDRTPAGGWGAAALAEELAGRYGVEARTIGSEAEPRAAGWEEDLRDSRGCILEAGGQVEDALAEGAFPVLLAAECSIAITTLGAVLLHEPEARFLWLDAHGDFNTPDTTASGYLGGMCLAAACGRWAAGMPPNGVAVDPARVVLCGVRDLDGPERVELERAGVVVAERPSLVPEHLRGHPVYVHLDVDVLDPGIFPAQFPVSHGLSDTGLRSLLAEVSAGSRVVGVEVTAFEAPAAEADRARLARLIADCLAPMLPAPA